MFLPKWLESQSARGAIAGPGASDNSRPDDASPHDADREMPFRFRTLR